MNRTLLLLIVSIALVYVSQPARCAAADKPNIIYIMSDDMGFSDIGCYGSEIQTPNLNKLADNGLRFTQFYNTARCCPTRASLITGLYPHQAGVGHMMNDRGFDGYRGDLNRQCVTIPEALKSAGYKSYMSGKWHVTKTVSPKTDADKHNWPMQRGFDRFYGTIHGAGSFFDPNTLTRGNEYISPFADPKYTEEHREHKTFYYTDAISDHASRFIREHHYNDDDKPFFMYVAFTAAHWPMHALPHDIEKYRGKYDGGYDAIRNARYKRMIELGLINKESTVNWPIPEDWKEKEHWDWDKRNMEVYAAMIDSMDQGIGRIVESLKDTGQFENTLVCFFQDNGGCAEGYGRGGQGGPRPDSPNMPILAKDYLQPDMTPKQSRDGYAMRTGKGSMSGPADTAIGYGKGWATVSNTPFREYKHWTHEGGISTPLIVHWPAKLKRKGELEHTPGHLVDLMATAVDVADASYPAKYHDGKKIKPMEGVSLLPAFMGQSIGERAIFWEHEGNRAIRKGDHKLVAKGAKGKWELYNIKLDRSEQNDLADKQPELANELMQLWQAYAERANVLPLNPNSGNKNKSNFNRKQRTFELDGDANLSADKGPYIVKRPLDVSAKVNAKSDGVIVAQGGVTHGWSLYLQDSMLRCSTTINSERTVLSPDVKIIGGETVGFRLDKSGELTLRIGDKQIASKQLPGLFTTQPQDGLQVGKDTGGAAGPYKVPFTLDGSVDKVTITLK